ncbi:MAG: FeoB-associated Cys-rich membrane protein [Planctomycetes bacterium]|nr:FeoB-associated Cys-rich membrane protein [Planctomycetota bacterium]
MSTALQFVLVGAIVALAAGYLLRATWKTWFGRSKAGCGSGCGTCAAPAPDAGTPGRRPLPMA